MTDQQPTPEVMREILTAKRDQFRAQGYDAAIAERIALAIGDQKQADAAKRKSGQAYQAAKVCDDELAALEGEPRA